MPNDRLILFGSQARNEANEDSDWDLLVILNKPIRDFKDILYYMTVRLGVEKTFQYENLYYGRVGKSKPSLFYKNVESEGIEII